MARDGYLILDSDLHIMEPDDLWARYLEERYQASAPRFFGAQEQKLAENTADKGSADVIEGMEVQGLAIPAHGKMSSTAATGGKGLHIMVPIKTEMAWNTAHDYTGEIAERLAATAPGKYTTSAAFSARPGKLFIDYLRNGRGTTAVGAYSPRARPGFAVAAPVIWREVEHGVRPGDFTMVHPPRRARRRRPS